MIQAEILTEWTTTPEDLKIPKLAMDFAFMWPAWWQEATGEPENIIPDPNIAVLRIFCEQSTLDAIQSHADYGPGAILYDMPNPYSPNEPPPAAEYGQRRSYCARLGISQVQFRAMFGTQSNPNTRKAGADNLKSWCKTLPKGKDK